MPTSWCLPPMPWWAPPQAAQGVGLFAITPPQAILQCPSDPAIPAGLQRGSRSNPWRIIPVIDISCIFIE